MQVSDPFRLIDWEIKKFLGFVWAVQIAALAIVGLDLSGVQVPILRQLVCFVYLTFIPGALVLRALRIHKLGAIVSALFTVGASLASLMFTGVLLNFAGPYLGIARPISLLPIMAILALFVLILSIVCYLRDKKIDEPALLDLKEALSPPALLLYIVPFLAILGAVLMNVFNTNILLVLMILAAVAILLLVGFDKFIPKELYPLALFVVAVSLVLHNSLISYYINGWDIHFERYRAMLVITNGFWDPSAFNVLTSMLSIVMIAPIYSIVLNMDIVWIFKVIYPLLFALVPVGLYEVFKRQSNEKIAFLSVFFFTSLVVFYTEMLQLARQEIAELFLVLVVMLIIDKSMDKLKWSALFVIFSFSLVLSHYGLTYIFIASLVVVWVLLSLSKKIQIKQLAESDLNRRLSIVLILALITFCLIWYIYTASSNPFLTIVAIVSQIGGSLFSNFLNPEAVQGLALISSGGSASALHKILLYLMLFTQALVLVGVLTILFKNELVRIGKEYYTFSLIMIAILIAGITIPFFASALNTTRLYQIALIFLAIFFVIGWLNVSRFLGRLVGRHNEKMPIAYRTLAIFLAIFLVFNTGLIFEVTNDVPMSYSLNKSVDNEVYNYAEVAGADWVVAERNATPIDNKPGSYYLPPIYSDGIRRILVDGQNVDQVADIPGNNSKIFNESFVFLGTYNIENGQVLISNEEGTITKDTYIDASGIERSRGRVYANGGSEIYH